MTFMYVSYLSHRAQDLAVLTATPFRRLLRSAPPPLPTEIQLEILRAAVEDLWWVSAAYQDRRSARSRLTALCRVSRL